MLLRLWELDCNSEDKNDVNSNNYANNVSKRILIFIDNKFIEKIKFWQNPIHLDADCTLKLQFKLFIRISCLWQFYFMSLLLLDPGFAMLPFVTCFSDISWLSSHSFQNYFRHKFL